MSEYKLLFSPCKINKLEVKNRIVFEPMGNGLAGTDGSCGDEQIAFYGARAKGGVGLIMSEACSVDSVTGRGNIKNLCIDRDELIPGYKRLADEIHRYGSAMFIELYHPGGEGHCADNGDKPMLTPSGIECGLTHEPVVEMTLDQIHETIQKFIEGAVRCQKAGLDGVTIHAAHGYLIGQFLSPHTNKRQDSYGGTEQKRARFALEIIEGIRKACGPDFPIAVRISADEFLDYIGLPKEEGITLELSKNFSRMFEAAGADMIDVSSGNYETMNTAWEPAGFDQGWKSHLAKEIKSVVRVPVSCVSVIRDPAYAEHLLETGNCDFIGSARTHMADAEWANKVKEGREREIRRCISCLNCMKTLIIPDVSCGVNPQACHETTRSDIRKDGAGRTVVVVGAGPAGMEAARILALREFRVVLLEKSDRLGGQMNLAAVPPHKGKIRWFIDYLAHQMELLGVEVHLNVDVTPELVQGYEPYAVFLAAGTNPIVPRSIPGIFGDNVCTSTDVLTGARDVSNKKVVLVGCGMNGLETAEYLVEKGNTVEAFDMLPEVAPGELFQNIIDVEMRIGPVVPQHTKHRLISISETGCTFENLEDNSTVEYPCEVVVLSLGMAPQKDLVEQFANIPNCHVIGTNVKYGPIASATESAFLAAYNL